MSKHELQIVAELGVKIFRPIIAAVERPSAAEALMLELGFRPPAEFKVFENLAGSVQSLKDVLVLLEEITVEDIQADPEVVIRSINELLDIVIPLLEDLKDIATIFQSELVDSELLDQTNILEEFPRKLVDYLVERYLRENYAGFYALLRLFSIVEVIEIEEVTSEVELPHAERKIHWDRIIDIFNDPIGLLKKNIKDQNTYFYYQIIYGLKRLGESLGLVPHYKDPERAVLQFLNSESDIENWAGYRDLEILRFPLIPNLWDGIAIDFYPLVDVANDTFTGIVMGIGVDQQVEYPFGDNFKLQFEFSGNASKGIGVLIDQNEEFRFIADLFASPQSFSENTLLRFIGKVLREDQATDQSDKLFQIGAPEGSRFEIGSFSLAFGIEKEQEVRLFIEVALLNGFIAINLSGADAFISSTVGSRVESNFNVGIGFSNRQGLYFKGSSDFEISLPTHIDLGLVEVKSLVLAALVKEDKLVVQAVCTLAVKLGPLQLSINNVGLSFPGQNVDDSQIFIPQIGYKPPTGLTLYIDGGGFKGGGSLNFEPEQGRYTGFLELSFQDSLSLKAIGILTTQLPNGQEGYSLLIVITAEFSPVQLGFGFTLNGVGGLLALNRTVNAERLRTGVRDNTLSSILFPQNIESNIDQIISDLRQVFPPQSDRFVFGPMLKIGWGSPSIITIDMGLLIEVPNPVRMQILGVLRAILPAEEEAVLRLQVNFLGEVDFEQKQLSFDASLYDSKLLAFTLSGDMAIRMYWGEKANFLLTVGGFHPAYQPPPMNLPDIRRLTLALLDGDNPRLKLETYFAVTSNTVQFGAKAELYAAAWKVNIYGFISFDVLFQFSPFRFIADVSAMLALRYGTSSFATIKLAFTLEGPTPWKAKGTASFKICWFFTLKVRFNKTFGIDQQIQLPAIPVLPGLLAAFNNPDNWEGVLPAGRYQLESFKDNEGLGSEQVLVHPIGILQVSQKLVPLNIRIQKFGYQRPADADQFSIEHIRLEAQPVQAPPAREDFAPAQFFEYKDEEKLSLPAFQSFDSGIRIADLDQASIEYAVAKAVKYELKYIDSIRDRRLDPAAGQQTLDPASFNTWTLQGAVAQSDLSYANNRKPVLAPQEVAIAEESYGVVNTSDLRLYDNNSLLANEIEAKLRRDQLIAENPALAETIQVLPAFEIIE